MKKRRMSLKQWTVLSGEKEKSKGGCPEKDEKRRNKGACQRKNRGRGESRVAFLRGTGEKEDEEKCNE